MCLGKKAIFQRKLTQFIYEHWPTVKHEKAFLSLDVYDQSNKFMINPVIDKSKERKLESVQNTQRVT